MSSDTTPKRSGRSYLYLPELPSYAIALCYVCGRHDFFSDTHYHTHRYDGHGRVRDGGCMTAEQQRAMTARRRSDRR